MIEKQPALRLNIPDRPQRAGVLGVQADWGVGEAVAGNGGRMNNTLLEFECIGMDDGRKFPIEYTGRFITSNQGFYALGYMEHSCH